LLFVNPPPYGAAFPGDPTWVATERSESQNSFTKRSHSD
jgi:hypothetical protein